jgi:hypothetical protein
MKKTNFWMAGAAMTLLATVSGCGGGSDNISTSHPAPAVTATLPTSATAGVAVSITNITATNAAAVVVDWGDGLQDAPATIPTSLTHTYLATATCVKAGSCVIDLSALSNGISTAAELKGTVVVSPAPTLAATFAPNGTAGQPYTVTGVAAANATGLSVDWGDGVKETPAVAATSLTHTYAAAGSYTIDMIASGKNGTSAEQKGSVTINPAAAPVLNATLPTRGGVGIATSITGISNNNGTALSVNWGDGTTDTPAVSSTTVSHTYGAAGTFTITMTLAGPPSSTPVTQSGSITINVPDLFISQYMTGTGSNKAIEIYNPTSAAVDLSAYSVTVWNNGLSSTTATTSNNAGGTLQLTGMLASHQTVLIYNSGAVTLKTAADAAVTAGTAIKIADGTFNANYAVSSQVTAFNGDDVIQLKKSGVVIDSFGIAGLRPTVSGSGATALGGWGKATTDNMYHTLIRKAGVVSGNVPVSSGTTPYWDPVADPNGYDAGTIDDYTNLGVR